MMQAPQQTQTSKSEIVLNHSIIQKLYENDMRIDRSIVEEILVLPRETLISDLENILRDIIASYSYYKNLYDAEEINPEFHLHALFILSELQAVQSLDILLEILGQDEEFLDLWFSDFLTESIWQFIITFGKDQLDILSGFIKEPDNYLYSKTAVSTAVSQLAMHYPERRQEAIEFYRELFNYFLNTENPNEELLGFLVSDVTDFGGVELKAEISQLFETGILTNDITGSLKDVMEDLISYDPWLCKQDRLVTCAEWYTEVLTTFYDYNETGDSNSDYDWDFISRLADQEESNTKVNSGQKVQRNDPCPCGSGIKYKKCHGKS